MADVESIINDAKGMAIPSNAGPALYLNQLKTRFTEVAQKLLQAEEKTKRYYYTFWLSTQIEAILHSLPANTSYCQIEDVRHHLLSLQEMINENIQAQP